MRDGMEIPLVMTYDKLFFNEKSPWIMFTQGADSTKNDLQFDQNKISILNRGLCLCFPLIRGNTTLYIFNVCTGSRYFDDNWFYSGASDRKQTHIFDFIDSAVFLKEKGLAPKIGAIGTGESGSLTTLASVFAEPLLFDAAVVHVTIRLNQSYRTQ